MSIQSRIFGNPLAIPADIVAATREAKRAALADYDETTALNKAGPVSTVDPGEGQQPSQTTPDSVQWQGPKIVEPHMNRKARRRLEALERKRPPRPQPRPASKKSKFSSGFRQQNAAPPPPAPRTWSPNEYALRLAMHFKKVVNASGQFHAFFRSDYGETPWTLVVLDPGLTPEQEQAIIEALPTPDPRFVALLEVHPDHVAFTANSQRTEAVTALRELVQHATKGPAAAPAKEQQP